MKILPILIMSEPNHKGLLPQQFLSFMVFGLWLTVRLQFLLFTAMYI